MTGASPLPEEHTHLSLVKEMSRSKRLERGWGIDCDRSQVAPFTSLHHRPGFCNLGVTMCKRSGGVSVPFLSPEAHSRKTTHSWSLRHQMRSQFGLNKWKKHTKPEVTALPTPSAAKFWLLHLDQLTELFKPYFSHLDSGKIVSSPLLGDVSEWSNSWLCSEQSLILNKR